MAYAQLLTTINEEYAQKIRTHGATSVGVGWNGDSSQKIRFEQLRKLVLEIKHFSCNDLGCAYGAFFHYLKEKGHEAQYNGFDVCEESIKKAQENCKNNVFASFYVGSIPMDIKDYSFSSGIFNDKFGMSDEDWLVYIKENIKVLNNFSKKGFAFNCLTRYSDPEKMKSNLYYANPGEIFDYCKANFSRNVALLHDYELYDFTIIVRK